ncbi:MAG: hypothetical protein SH868_06000 [Bythopirellula sp.]|nr:hypothetical protein [Bythopirellula sp.]
MKIRARWAKTSRIAVRTNPNGHSMRGQVPARCLLQVALAVCAVLHGGCTCLPRIDPSGERVFLRPNQQQATLVAATGNPTAAPVLTDAIFPQPVLPVATTTPGMPVAVVATATVPPETLTMTPDRVLAPVGTEVVLKTGICTDQNYLVTSQKIDWLIASGSAGELVELGGRGLFNKPLLPWNKGKKIDNQYGIGYTAKVPLTIDRGTADTSDDVQIEPGHAWASITSPVEGTSHVTAVAPVVAGWPQRRAQAAIYWVDVQWEFPPAAVSSSSSQVLSTIVRRQTDGTPLCGWVVRYEVASGTGSITSGTSGQIVEVVTGADGRASVDITPTGGTGSSTQIAMQLVRPAELPIGNMPRLIIANSSTTINWNGGNSYLPPADNLGGTIPTYPIPGDTGSSQPTTPITPTPPSAQPSTSQRPVLDIEIIGNDTGQIGGETRFEVIIRNTGDAPATSLVITDQFDAGFNHPNDNLGTQKIEKPLSITLSPGQSHKEFITFSITRAGSLCHDVTVRSAEGAEAAKRACITVPQAELGKQPGMEVRKDGPRQSTVGETTLFTLSVKNTGEVPLTNLEILDEYDNALLAKPRTPNYEVIRNPDNKSRFLWRLPLLAVGETQRFEVDATCQAPKQRACSLASVTAEGGPGVGMVPSADDHCIEILESRAPGAAGPTDVVPPVGGASGGLRLSISPYNKKPIVGSRATYQFFVENASNTPDEELQLRVIFPPELVPDMATVQAKVAAQLVGNELRFNPIAMIRANERISFTVTSSVLRAGIVNVVAEVVSSKSPQGVSKTEQVEIVGF